MDPKASALAQKIGDYCHQQYMGCTKSRNTGETAYDWDYSYTSEVINMVEEYFQTDEGKQALETFKEKGTV